jgi:hypothetical protein
MPDKRYGVCFFERRPYGRLRQNIAADRRDRRLHSRGISPMNGRSPSRLTQLLLLIPFVGLLWVPFYTGHAPELFGFPFFYWYQLIWVPITAALTWLVYRNMRHDD